MKARRQMKIQEIIAKQVIRTQEELADRASMDVTYLSDLERGRWNPALAMIVDLANGLEVHPSELLRELKVRPDDRSPARKRSQRQ